MAGNAAARMARRRLRGRKAGLCTMCFRCHTVPERLVCQPCSTAAAERVIRRRAEKRRIAKASANALRYERAGDEAGAHHLYVDAAEHYQRALSVSLASALDELRISEKLAYALGLGREPAAATPLLDTILAMHLQNPEQAAKSVEILLQRARQLFLEARTEDALPVLRQAIHIATAAADLPLYKLAGGRMSSYLVGLGRYDEAKYYIDAIAVDETDDVATRATYYTQRATLASAFGNAVEAFDYFEQAVCLAKADQDVFHLVRIWNAYGVWALRLGNIELAKSCHERSLFAARQYNVTVAIPEVSLDYVSMLTCSGRYALAREYLLEALSCRVQSQLADVCIAGFGIPLALHMKDGELLSRSALPSAVNSAFRSGMPDMIGPVAAAFAQWHASRGRRQKAKQLLARALSVLKRTEQPWDLPIAVARFGATENIPQARMLVAQLASLPNSRVAQACLQLFDAFVAQRNASQSEMHERASQAAKSFESLGWYGFSDLARTLCPVPIKDTMLAAGRNEPLPDMLPGLTPRENQVADLVLKGLTNREIAERLAISKHTVDSHVASIIGRLGIRSRYQLMNIT